MLRRPPRSTLSSSSAASDVYKRQVQVGDRRERVSFANAGFLEDLLIEAEALERAPVEGAAESPKRFLIPVDDDDVVPLDREHGRQLRTHSAAPYDDDVHAAY